ncbi:MAG: [FeFe] hydrogenase H-cluster radical SAM maturase HydG [bacterium]
MEKKLSGAAQDFIENDKLHSLLERKADSARIREIIAKSLAKTPLLVEETAALINADEPELIEEILEGARELKRRIYGNRIVLFAPLYIGNLCVNECAYCGFRRSNKEAHRRTLNDDDIRAQVSALVNQGHKRLILVYGEHPRYDAHFMADTVRRVYSIKSGKGEIRRVNINAAPLDHEGYKIVHEAGIGTYQIFQETYHHETYRNMHPPQTLKGDYMWRLDGLNRAFEAGCDDVGIGALFGLYDWRFEVLGLVSHAAHLMKHYNCGPHTISFPRLRPASNVRLDAKWQVSDEDFKRLVAILRLSVPYTGMILTAREPAALRREVMAFGVSQIDAGSRIEIGGYTEVGDAQQQNIEKEQFQLGDVRSLDEVIRELAQDGYIPSFCTACYRKGRTGQHFMEFAIPGFIERLCTPNALCSGVEYMTDYASPATARAFEKVERDALAQMPDNERKRRTLEKIKAIKETDQRDLYF